MYPLSLSFTLSIANLSRFCNPLKFKEKFFGRGNASVGMGHAYEGTKQFMGNCRAILTPVGAFMSEKKDLDVNNIEKIADGQKTRRSFVKTAAQVAVTAPAVGLLLSATTKPAAAQISAYQASQLHILDDFTFGNNEEDIDAFTFGNFNPVNGTTNLDDHV